MAPANSMTVAIDMAWAIVRDLDDTEVAKELATSLAPVQGESIAHQNISMDLPMLKASRKANITPTAKM
jgi:hypothetical protein